MKKTILFMLCFIILCAFVGFSSYAKEPDPMEYIDKLGEALPEEVEKHINTERVENIADSGKIISLSGALFSDAIKALSGTFLKITLVILISSVAQIISSAFHVKMPDICTWVASVCVSVAVYSVLEGVFSSVEAYLENVNKFMTAMGGVGSALYLLGGNIRTSVASVGATAAITLIIEKICIKYLVPIMRISFASSLAFSISRSENMKKISDFMRKCFLTLLIFMMTVVTVMFAFQTAITASADSVAVRSLRYVAINSIPIVGGAVGESLRTLTAGLKLSKSVCGTYGVVAVIIMSLAPLINLAATKFAISLSESVSSLFAEGESLEVLSESRRIIDSMMAVVALFGIVFIFMISVFINTGIAISG